MAIFIKNGIVHTSNGFAKSRRFLVLSTKTFPGGDI